jgi:hypothetical protein
MWGSVAGGEWRGGAARAAMGTGCVGGVGATGMARASPSRTFPFSAPPSSIPSPIGSYSWGGGLASGQAAADGLC